MSEPDDGDLVELREPVEGAVRADGPVVVVTAMSLKPAVREALAQRLGPGYIVRDIKDVVDTADVVLVPAVSGQLVGALREMFPGAKILVTELSDVEFGLDLPGPVSRLMRSGVDGYFVAPDLGQLAAATRDAASGVSVAALTTGARSSTPWELEAQQERQSAAVLHLVASPERGPGHQPGCFVLDVTGWLQQLHPDGADPVERLRCTGLAWTTALQLLDGGIDVAVSGVDHGVWRSKARERGVTVVEHS